MAKRTLLITTLLTLLMSLLAACGGTPPAAVETAPAAADAPAESASEESTASDNTEQAADSAVSDAAGLTRYVILPEASKASYLVDEVFLAGALDKLGIAAGDYDIVGSTTEIEGELLLDLAQTAIGPSEFRVNVASLTTDQDRRDNWIRENGPKLNDYPLAVFVATGVENAPSDYVEGEETTFQLLGDLTIREITQPVTFDVTATLADDTITGVAQTALKLTDFGIDPPNFANTLKVADDFMVQVELTAQKQAD